MVAAKLSSDSPRPATPNLSSPSEAVTMGCPFYGKNEDICDVGCGYVSPHDAKIISQFCSTHPDDCPRYQYLMEREAEPATQPAAETPTPLPKPGETSPGRTPKPVPAKPSRFLPAPPFSTLPPLGLICFGLTTLIFSLRMTSLLPLPEWLFQFAILTGGLGQFAVGILEWSKKQFFSATALTGYGFFWISLLLLIPPAGQSPATMAPATSAYLLLWGLFSAVLLAGARPINRSLPCVFGSAALLFFLLATSYVTNHWLVGLATLLAGFGCGLTALRAVPIEDRKSLSSPSRPSPTRSLGSRRVDSRHG